MACASSLDNLKTSFSLLISKPFFIGEFLQSVKRYFFFFACRRFSCWRFLFFFAQASSTDDQIVNQQKKDTELKESTNQPKPYRENIGATI